MDTWLHRGTVLYLPGFFPARPGARAPPLTGGLHLQCAEKLFVL
jgi:hypothetical protein